VKLAQNARSHAPSEPAKKNEDGCCGCLVLIVVIGVIIAFFV